MPKIDLSSAPVKTGSIYPVPFNKAMAGRSSVRLGVAGGLTQFGVNLVTLEPGALSSLRHWHLKEDEFVIVTEGTCTLIDDSGEYGLAEGESAAFPAGDANGHHLINKTDIPAKFLVVGTRADEEVATYSDVDMKVTLRDGAYKFTRKDGSAINED